MTLQVINIPNPVSYKGMEDYSNDPQDQILEIVRRLEMNTSSLTNALRDQVVVDTSIMPSESSGEASVSTSTIATSTDTDDAMRYASLQA